MKPVFDKNGLATVPGDMRCFYYDAETSEYTGWSDEYINTGVSMPVCSTGIDPGENIPGKVAVFTGKGWSHEEDHRNETVYSTENGAAVTVDYIGAIKNGYVTLSPLTTYDKWDGEKWVTDTEAQHNAAVEAAEAQRQSLIDASLFKILCKCLFSEVTVQAVTELDNKAAHCHSPVLQRHRPFLGRRLDCQPHHFFHRVVCREHFTLFDRMADHAV